MPLRLEIKKKLTARSERVKSVDLHPSEPLVLAALYSGSLQVWNFETQTLLKSFEATTQPIRCAKFITRKQWIVAGSDDMMLRIYNYNTLEKVKEFEAHVDYIRSLEVHPTLPYVLSASDDMQIKLWDWEKNWTSNMAFDGHAHYIMCIKFNPKDSNTFATASLDRSIKIWSLTNPLPNYSLEGHEQGVNAIDYFTGGEKPYLVSGADDLTIKIWDYQTKTCVQTLDGHSGNVSTVMFHPKLPLIISGSEDGTVRLWHNTTYRLETTLNYGMERVWSVGCSKESNRVAIGYDEGTVVLSLGQDEVVCSMENVNGKVLIVRNNEVSVVSVRGNDNPAVDGETLALTPKELGSCELYAQQILHSSNGRFVAIIGDGEYIIYTAQALRNKAFGSGLSFGWSSLATGDYCVLTASKKIKVYKNFVEKYEKNLAFSVEKVEGGPLIGLVSDSGEFVVFLDWESGEIVRKIEVKCEKIVWNSSGEKVAIVCDDSFYILGVDQPRVIEIVAQNKGAEADFDECFELLNEVSESASNGCFVGDCFLFANKQGTKLNYYINNELVTLSNLDRKMSLLNYVPKENRVFLIDQSYNIVSYELLESVLQYQTAVVRHDFDLANEVLKQIPPTKYDDIARFLDSQGFASVAINVARDPDLKFDLAIQLQDLSKATSVLEEIRSKEDEDIELGDKWRMISDLALSKGDIFLAEKCAVKGKDLSGLLLIYTSLGNKQKLRNLMALASEENQLNIAFNCAFLLNDLKSCVASLEKCGRYSESALFSRTYLPSHVPTAVTSWKDDLVKLSPFYEKIADSIANVDESIELFPGYEESLEKEATVVGKLSQLRISASNYQSYADNGVEIFLETGRKISSPYNPVAPSVKVAQEAKEEQLLEENFQEEERDLEDMIDQDEVEDVNEDDDLLAMESANDENVTFNENDLSEEAREENLQEDIEYYNRKASDEAEVDFFADNNDPEESEEWN